MDQSVELALGPMWIAAYSSAPDSRRSLQLAAKGPHARHRETRLNAQITNAIVSDTNVSFPSQVLCIWSCTSWPSARKFASLQGGPARRSGHSGSDGHTAPQVLSDVHLIHRRVRRWALLRTQPPPVKQRNRRTSCAPPFKILLSRQALEELRLLLLAAMSEVSESWPTMPQSLQGC
jgi:hypothetical protein